MTKIRNPHAPLHFYNALRSACFSHLKYRDTFPFDIQALPLLDEMLEVQSAEVDTVSGATLTAEGLIGAVEDALGKAAG